MAQLKLRDSAFPDELKCYDHYECTNCDFHISIPKSYAYTIYKYPICPNCCSKITDVIKDESNIVTMEYFTDNEKHFKKINLENETLLEEVLRDIILFFPIRLTDEEQREKWNNYVEENFIYLNKDYRDVYQPPYLDTNKWYTYYSLSFVTLEKYKQLLKERSEYLDMVDKII